MKNNKIWIGFIVLALFVGAGGMYFIIKYFPLESITINKSEKEVTVTDSGISAAVDKLYDAVVVVESFKNGTAVSSGSGFVYKKDDKKGYILTNNHVIDGADTVKVVFTNGKTETVTVVGKEVYSDIAVLSLSADKVLAVAEIGKNSDMKIGDTVFTVGAPINTSYYGTVTRGILSGKDRMVSVKLSSNTNSNNYMMNVIQTDAAINSGNSGGPLANYNGEVIGITSLKLISTGVEGIGFAIPIEDALESATILENEGEIVRPYLGISMLDTTETYLLLRYGITLPENASGVVVIEIGDDTPAEKCGLKMGDVITKVGDAKVTSIAEFKYALYKYKAGDEVEIQVVRNNSVKTLSAKLVASGN